jgi:hypothetical protein
MIFRWRAAGFGISEHADHFNLFKSTFAEAFAALSFKNTEHVDHFYPLFP